MNSAVSFGAPFVASFAAALILTPVVRHYARTRSLMAKPVADRWHEQPTPLLGGVAVFGGFVAGGLIGFWRVLKDSSPAFFIENRAVIGIIAASSLMFFIG